MNDGAIGGYFGLELNSINNDLSEWGQGYQSARASLYAILKAKKIKKVWVPKYICGCVLDPINALGIEIIKYDIDISFRIKNKVTLSPGDVIIYVNYFGLCDQQEREISDKYPAKQIIFDHSQAFYSKPVPVLATIYSPRKFFGLPDGGFLFTNEYIVEPTETDHGSVQRSAFLFTRLNDGPEAGYQLFKDSNQSLSDFKPRKMSCLTSSLLDSIDLIDAKNIRNKNFEYLNDKLNYLNELKIPETYNGPLCYPLLIRKNGIREFLIENRVFVATYWPDVLNHIESGSDEEVLVNFLLAIPCDQRYSEIEMRRISELIKAATRQVIGLMEK